MIGERFQFTSISNNFIHSCQLGRLKHKSTTDAGVALSHFVYSGWIKNLITSTLAFDIMQFFPFLNHQLLPYIMDKASFDPKVLVFFKNYLVGRLSIFGTIFLLIFLMLMLVSVKDLLFLQFYLLFIYLQFFSFLKNSKNSHFYSIFC